MWGWTERSCGGWGRACDRVLAHVLREGAPWYRMCSSPSPVVPCGLTMHLHRLGVAGLSHLCCRLSGLLEHSFKCVVCRPQCNPTFYIYIYFVCLCECTMYVYHVCPVPMKSSLGAKNFRGWVYSGPVWLQAWPCWGRSWELMSWYNHQAEH